MSETIDVEFGDHPSKDPLGSLRRICDALDEHQAPATMFVQGRWARAFPDLVAEFASRDVTIGLHGYSHVDYRRLSVAGIRAELADGLLRLGLPVRPSPGAIRITVHRPDADDRLLAALGELLAAR